MSRDVDERLLWLLRRAGDEWGPAGVAKAAASLVEPQPALYVNHPRTEPVIGDVVRSATSDSTSNMTWVYADPGANGPWRGLAEDRTGHFERAYLPERLRLLVDGETGQAVTS